jgi:hypothetical protein
LARSPSSPLLPQPILGRVSSRVRESGVSGVLPQPILGAQSAVAEGSPAKRRAKAPPPTSARQAGLQADRALVSGIGGLGFRALSPPGSGRLVRIPFYPQNPTEAWTGGSGISAAGDDPILNLIIPAGSQKSNKLTMLTYQFDYGAYKILGLQTNYQGSYNTGFSSPVPGGPPVVPLSPLGVGISVGNLSLYNGQTLFVQLEDMDASTFQLLPDFRTDFLTTAAGSQGSQRENPYNYLARRSRFFPGLRDYPVVFGTANVTMTVQAFIGQPMTGGVNMNIPFSCYVVADLVEDYVFGDPVINSPAARAGANVKLGAKDMGLSPAGVRQYDLQSARYPRKS